MLSRYTHLSILALISLTEGLLGFLGFAVIILIIGKDSSVFGFSLNEIPNYYIILFLVIRLFFFIALRELKLVQIRKISTRIFYNLSKHLNAASNDEMKRFLASDIGSYISGYNAFSVFLSEIIVLLLIIVNIRFFYPYDFPYFSVILFFAISFAFQSYYRNWLQKNTINSLIRGTKYQNFLEFLFSNKLYFALHKKLNQFLFEFRNLGGLYVYTIFQKATFKSLTPNIFEGLGLLAASSIIFSVGDVDIAIVLLGVFARFVSSISRISSSHQGIVVYLTLNNLYDKYSRDKG